ncbi:MAG: glycosyltransferase family 2 protein, partial [Chloroflexota bacterium]|nr:glycosyltransferase family 2 protein [Chloroflexota bacterium]
MPNGHKVVVTMPAYNAARTLHKTLQDIPRDAVDDLILVDDASSDDTVEVAKRLGIHTIEHAENRGYGGNQKTCYDAALARGADVIVLLHPDYQYDPKMLTDLIAPILGGRADFTFGSRFLRSARDPLRGGMPLYRWIGNRATTLAENLLLHTKFSELHSGYKAYNRFFLENIAYHGYSNAFVFDSQMLIDAVLSRRFRIEEVAIPTKYTAESSSASVSNS